MNTITNAYLFVMEDKILNHLLDVIRASLNEYTWLFEHIRAHNGSLHLPDQWISFLTRIDQPAWATFYEAEELPNTLALFTVKGIAGVAEIQQFIKGKSKDELETIGLNLEKGAFAEQDKFDEKLSNLKLLNTSNFDATLKSMSDAEREEETTFLFYFLNTVVTGTFNFLSLITHGKGMVALVQEAKQGDDSSFYKAVQIDATVLYAIPYFQQRLARLQLSDNPVLRSRLSRAIKGKVLSDKIDKPEIRLIFALLHSKGFLTSLSNDRLLDICKDLVGYESDDVNSISKLKNRFLKGLGHQK